jgi:AAA15 family ATPase/GTPase
MLVEFSVANYLSFRDKVTLSMVATRKREHTEANTIQTKDLRLVKTAVIYGANASGKSNLIEAMSSVRRFIRDSSKESQVGEEISWVDSFKLSTQTENEPSFFEVVFISDNVRYRYGFELDMLSIKEEWLYRAKSNGDEVELFYRINDQIEVSDKFTEGKGLEERTRNNALFLSVVANFKGKTSEKVLQWFYNFNVLSGLSEDTFNYTEKKLNDSGFKKKFMELVKHADLGIEDVEVDSNKDIPEELIKLKKMLMESNDNNPEIRITKQNLYVKHNKFDENNKLVGHQMFSLFRSESEGTKKVISLLGPIIDTLERGRMLVIDELDAKLHPILTRFIVGLFHDSTVNKNNAQLIFNTHDTNILSSQYFRRDQIWFTEKDSYGATDLYSLVEYNVRSDKNYEKNYLQGKYGSIPYIGNRNFDFGDKNEGDLNGK